MEGSSSDFYHKLLKDQNFKGETLKEIDKSELKNIKIITSDFCGLGKSGKIRKEIKEKNKKYFHFPLGGKLNKNIIFDKLEILLDKIKNENYEKVAIHLDLTESEEISILNEFFFSFLITKFYTNNEKILYIPKGIFIYIEIPNCFEVYLAKISILNMIEKENITFETMPDYDYPKEITSIFIKMLGLDSNKDSNKDSSKYYNEKIKEYVQKNIGIEKYSFHQINIFIKLFKSQYDKFDCKFIFIDNGKIETSDIIRFFYKSTKYFTNGNFSKFLIGEFKSTKKEYIDVLSEVYNNDLANIDFSDPLIFINYDKQRGEYHHFKFYIPTKDSKEYKGSKDYLKKMKELLNLPNKVEKEEKIEGVVYKSLLSIIEEENNNYVITNDNFKKMILLVYRIIADVPVIIMGDTGCGKTALITKLNQLLNNGKKTVEIVDINPAIKDEDLCKIMEEKNLIAQDQKEELWVFFDEINTCPCLSLMTEIFVNRTFNGKKISENIRLIGACNPYRKRKGNKEKCGLSFSDDNENELVYLVNPLPQSLLYYVYSFGSINEEDEKKYIYSIIENLFPKEEKEKLKKIKKGKEKELEEKKNKKPTKKEERMEYEKEIKKLELEIKIITRELEFHDITKEAISQCHKYLRIHYDDSVVSLREIARFPKLVTFFEDYFKKKNEFLKNTTEPNRTNNEKNNKIRSIICSIYLCYYIRLTDEFKRSNFELELKPILLKLVSYEDNKATKLREQIQIEDLKTEIEERPKEEINEKFSDFLKIEQNFLIKQINPDKGIGKNTLLKENVFLLFVSVITNIPLVIIGKPGTGKSLSVQLINNSSKGEYSNNKFFKLYSKIIQTYFQGSLSTETKDVENLFTKISDKLKFYKNLREQQENDGMKDVIKLPISMACFDELGLAERSKNNPLKVLHPKLDFAGKEPNESFVGLSNYSLDAAKLNRALVSSVPDLDQQKGELYYTATKIVKGIAPKIKDDKIFEVLSNTYFEYKQKLQKIKELMVYKKVKKHLYKTKDEEQEIKLDGASIDGQSSEENNKKVVKNKGTFDGIKENKIFKKLMKKESKIKKDFHGNRDFYNLIKGVASSLRNLGELQDKDKVEIIGKYIERNFGGIIYNISIDFDDIPDDIHSEADVIKNILDNYGDDSKKTIQLNSIFLFKELYNIECDKIYKNIKDITVIV